jgi:hypothetical protein
MSESSINPELALFDIQIELSDGEQQQIVSICNRFKQGAIAHAGPKKRMMQRCYAYLKSQFYGDDLLPVPSAIGAEHDNNDNRPEIFIPVVREQVKLLYSQLKMTLLGTGEDYFRVRGKTADAARYEEVLSAGLRYIFKDARIGEKMGQFLLDLIWSGNAIACPVYKQDTLWAWELDALNQQFVPKLTVEEATLDIDVWDPLHFYIDPGSSDPETARWGYFTTKKLQDVMDQPGVLNQAELSRFNQTTGRTAQMASGLTLDVYNDLNQDFQDTEAHVEVDQFFFPIIKTDTREYRNMRVSVAGQQVLVEFKPNLMPKGMNPAVFCTWMPDKASPYGTGPVEDIQDLQRLINILYNYQIETFARIGNRFIVREGVDLTQFWGVAGGIATATDPKEDIVALHGDYAETQNIANLIGTLKAEATQLAGSHNPFQGGSQIDFKKTATEIQLLTENSTSVIREVIEHISVMGVQRILERLMLMAADLFMGPITIRQCDESGVSKDISVNLGLLKSGDYSLELTTTNASQSRQAQLTGLMQLVQTMTKNPTIVVSAKPLIKKIGVLWGIKDIDQLLEELTASSQKTPDLSKPISDNTTTTSKEVKP